MKVKDILNILENGTLISIYDSTLDDVLVMPMYLGANADLTNGIKYIYGDRKVLIINTHNEDDDIELVIK